MIIAKKFSLGHIPRTAGTKTATLLNNFRDVLGIEVVVSQAHHEKHFNFKWWECYENKKLMLNFRRLIPWMRSIVDFYQKVGVWPERKRVKVTDVKQITDPSLKWGIDYNKEFEVPLAILPDTYIKYFTQDFAISEWIRCEHLHQDLIEKVIKPHIETSVVESMGIELGDSEINKLVELLSKNSNFGSYVANYDRNMYNYFTVDDMKKIYENNPLWAAIEKEQYGNLFYQITK